MIKYIYKTLFILSVFLFCGNTLYSQSNSARTNRTENLLSPEYWVEPKTNLKSDVRPQRVPLIANPKSQGIKPMSIPGNDDCVNADMLTVGTTCTGTLGDNDGATESMPASVCGGWQSPAAYDVWYSFVANSSNQTIIVSESTDFDSVVELLDGCNGSSLACSDNSIGGGSTEQIKANGLTPGMTYYIRVYNYGSTAALTTTFDICVFDTSPPPANDECTDAISITVAANEASCNSIQVNTQSATQSSPDPLCAGISNDDDIWYSFVAISKTTLVKAENLGSGVTGVGFVIYEDACGGNESIECTVQATNDQQDFKNLTIGKTYYLRVFTTGTGDGTFDMCVFAPPPPPANDECSGAILISTAGSKAVCSPTSVDTKGALQSTPDPTCAFTSNDDDVWYKFIATDSVMTVEASNLGANVFGVGMLLYEDNCGGIQSTECTTSALNNKQKFKKLTIGKTYYLRTFTSGSGGGTFDICVYRTPIPQNDNCSGAISIAANGKSCSGTNGSVDGAYQSIPPANCNGITSFSAIDVWYKFVASSKRHTVKVTGSSYFDPVVQIFKTCGDTSLICSDKLYGNGTTETIIDTNFSINTTYYVRVYSYGSEPQTSDFSICVFETPNPPANDNCAGAIKINPGANGYICQPNIVTTVSATKSTPDPTCTSYDNDDDVWYYFIASDTTMTVKSANYGAGINAVGFTLYSDSCNGAQSTECSTWANSGAQTFNKLVKGKTYYLRTYTYSNSGTGTYDICLIPGKPLAKNDECSAAVELNVNNTCIDVKGDVLGGTQSLAPIDCGTGASSAALDVWFSFVANANNAAITVKGSSSFDAIVELFDGCNGNAIGCSDNTFSAGTEKITTSSIVSGNTYYVRVYSYGSSIPNTSTFDICVTSQISVGLKENDESNNLNVFPNPAGNELNIVFNTSTEKNLNIRLFNSNGQMLYHHTANAQQNAFTKTISVENYPSGFYLLQVLTDKGVYNRKVLKE